MKSFINTKKKGNIMHISDALLVLNSKFHYESDKKYFDHWKILSNSTGWGGDCEDYALTLSWLISDGNIFKFLFNLIFMRHSIWFVRLPNGDGHAAIKIGGNYYDNIQKTGVSLSHLKERKYKFIYPMLFTFVFFKMSLAIIFNPIYKRLN